MKNFPIKIDNKEYWISRSIAVAIFIFTRDIDGDICILANRRGPGTPDFQGYWNCPCGYLDFDETIKEAACREVFEETGCIVTTSDISLFKVNDSPLENRQNVTFTLGGFIQDPKFKDPNGGEEDEVVDIKWIKLSDIPHYKWAFNHNEIINDIYDTFNYQHF